MKQKPGVMLHFDRIAPALSAFDDAQLGALFRSIVGYAKTGLIPDRLDAMTALAFEMLRPGIDVDEERYRNSVIHGQYMAYCRKCKEAGEKPIPETEWREQLIATSSN